MANLLKSFVGDYILPNPSSSKGLNGLVNSLTGAGDAWKSYTGQTANEIATKNLEYQKEFNQSIFEREDNAYQRLTADLTAAGLNPAFAMQHSSGAGAGGSSSAPQLSYTQEKALAPLTALLNIRKLLGDLDQQEATTQSIIGRTANDAAMTQGQLSFMRQQGALYGSQKELNDLDIANYGKKLEFDLKRTAAQTAQAEAAARQSDQFAEYYYHRTLGQMAENKWIDERYGSLVQKTYAEARSIKADAEKNEISNSFLARSLEMNLDLNDEQLKKLRRDNRYAPLLFALQTMQKSLDIQGTYWNLQFAQHQNLPLGVPLERSWNNHVGLNGVSNSWSYNSGSFWKDPRILDNTQSAWSQFIKERVDRGLSRFTEGIHDFFTGDGLLKAVDFKGVPYK